VINSKCIINYSGWKSIKGASRALQDHTLVLSMSLLKTGLQAVDNFSILNCNLL